MFIDSIGGRGRRVGVSLCSYIAIVLSHTPPVELIQGRRTWRHSLPVMSEGAILVAKRKVREHNGVGARKLERVKNNQLHTSAIIWVYVSADLAPLSYWTLGPRWSRLFKIGNSNLIYDVTSLIRRGDSSEREAT